MIERLRLGLVAGEASGDRLGAALIRAMQERVADLEVFGVAGDAMRATGCRAIASIDALSVMGLAEVLTQLPRLAAFRRRIARDLVRERPDLVVGIDSPDFNLGLEQRLRKRGVLTAHYVSPSVWAWRPRRVATVAQAAGEVLCLLPFEPACYSSIPVAAEFVGHPLADEIEPIPQGEARQRLGLVETGTVVALLPGSRKSEAVRLMPLFLRVATELARSGLAAHFLIPLARPALEPVVRTALRPYPSLPVTIVHGEARLAMAAAEAVLLASGTAALEALLLDRPMVVAYRVHAATAWLARRVGLQSTYFSLPNLLAGRELVPELLQERASVARIMAASAPLLENVAARETQRKGFAQVRAALGKNAAGRAADALLEFLARSRR